MRLQRNKYSPALFLFLVYHHFGFGDINSGCIVSAEIEESWSFTYAANGKGQIQVENFSKYKMSWKKQLKTILMDKELGETTNLCVEIMNSKRQVMGKLGHVVQIPVCRLT